jgi:hypothetical protein
MQHTIITGGNHAFEGATGVDRGALSRAVDVAALSLQRPTTRACEECYADRLGVRAWRHPDEDR